LHKASDRASPSFQVPRLSNLGAPGHFFWTLVNQYKAAEKPFVMDFAMGRLPSSQSAIDAGNACVIRQERQLGRTRLVTRPERPAEFGRPLKDLSECASLASWTMSRPDSLAGTAGASITVYKRWPCAAEREWGDRLPGSPAALFR
jgi:hypothetical protein